MKGIAKELLEMFHLNEADNPDGTDNDDGEIVLPGDFQHGFKSKVKSTKVINPILQELEISNSIVKPEVESRYGARYRKKIDDRYVIVSFGEDDYDQNTWEIEFTVNDQFNSFENKKIMFQVYQFVFDCLFSFIKKYSPNKIKFNGFTSQQDKIYDLFLKQLNKNIDNLGYNVSKEDGDYFLTKKEDLNELSIPDANIKSTKVINPILQELEISNTIIKPTESSEGFYNYKNIINGKNIDVGFIRENENLWEVSFDVDYKLSLNKEVDKDVFKIYMFVLNTVYSFLSEEKPKELIFQGFSSDQNLIYDFFVKSSKKKLNDMGYIIRMIQDYDGYETFSLTKKEDLNELSIPDANIKPTKEDNSGSNTFVHYETEIDNDFVKLVLNLDKDDYASVAFNVNNTMQIHKDKNINPMKIYNYIISCLYSFIKEYKPKGLYFMPYSNKHKENYDILGKLLCRDLKSKGYSITYDDMVEMYTISKDNDLEEMKKWAGL